MTLYKFSVGTVLAVAMVGVMGAGALVFSSRDFQYGVAQVAPSTSGRVDFAALDRVDADIAALREQTADTRRQFTEVSERIAALDRAEAAVSGSRVELVGGIANIEQRANVTDAGADNSTQALSRRINTLAGQQGLSAADQQAVSTLATQVAELGQQESAVEASGAERASLAAQQRLIGEQVEQSDSQIHMLQRGVVTEYEQYDRIRNEAHSLRSLSVLGVSAYLAQGHPSLLSTMLVLLMGALGSLLYLFPAYLNRAEPVKMSEVFVRLIFGMLAALAVYVVANGAIAGFSFGSSPTAQLTTTSATLNPFTVSLIGIIAGVMSEDIAAWIKERGRGVLGGAAASSSASSSNTAPTGGLVNNEAIR
jgi:hypothetical protein